MNDSAVNRRVISLSDLKMPQEMQFSVDWRFLVDIPRQGWVLLITDGYDGFAQPLSKVCGSKLVICSVAQKPIQNPETSADLNGEDVLMINSCDFPFRPQTFDLIVLPDGVVRKNQLSSLRRVLKSTGRVVMAFSNPLFFWRNLHRTSKKRFGSTTHSMKRSLKKAGFSRITFFGVMPNHRVPNLIFPLQVHLIQHALKSYYGHKIPSLVLSLLTTPAAVGITSMFFPAYICTAAF